ncbi:PREDICTED: uncharacterized protein LOC106751636 [Dinoponera quadriceps]|uniref:Uncharacterized protein LOC106751636 n=1 Tax=Dinoponera quadriceps TaxID=609295 RepID=A0A6P3YAR4_DINQU|nr:PREDICTED: uncharacterized protein LOC106751636 [Dinoponera quadriceps]
MRSMLSAVSCLSMAVCIMAGNLELGERVEGDYLCTNRTIFKPAIPWKPMRAMISVKTPTTDETITYVKFSNEGDKEADFTLIKGGVGTTSMVVMATGKFGEGMFVRVEGYAIAPVTTTEVPTTSVPTTEPVEVTTEETETSEE